MKYQKPSLNGFKPKRIPRKTIVTKLDEIVSLYVRKRDGKCVMPGCKSPYDRLTNGHIFSRTHHSTRWDISPDGNCHTTCWPHNFLHTYDQYPYFDWFKSKFGEEKFRELRRRWAQSYRFSDKELGELHAEIKLKYEVL